MRVNAAVTKRATEERDEQDQRGGSDHDNEGGRRERPNTRRARGAIVPF
jgi:hypothetical protein